MPTIHVELHKKGVHTQQEVKNIARANREVQEAYTENGWAVLVERAELHKKHMHRKRELTQMYGCLSQMKWSKPMVKAMQRLWGCLLQME